MDTTLYKYDIIQDVFDELKDAEYLSIDTETWGLHPHRDRLCAIQICYNKKVYIVQFPRAEYNKSPLLIKLLNGHSGSMIFHFAMFDVTRIYKWLRVKCNNIICTRTMSKITFTNIDAHGLKSCLKRLLGVQIYKTEQTSDWGKENLSTEQINYMADDVRYLYELYKAILPILQRESKEHMFKAAMNMIIYGAELELGHFPVDISVNYNTQ